MRLIDADALIDFFSNIQVELGAYRISFKAVNRAIDAMATIDIVRCKECIFADCDDKAEMYRCRSVSFPHWNKGEHFCSYGEREGER